MREASKGQNVDKLKGVVFLLKKYLELIYYINGHKVLSWKSCSTDIY